MNSRRFSLGVALTTLLAVGCSSGTPPLPAIPEGAQFAKPAPPAAKTKKKVPALGPDELAR